MILAIETSCDETSVAVVSNGVVHANLISSQTIHSLYGGVIPELASRAHLDVLSAMARLALEHASVGLSEISAIAVTSQPGLLGALLVGTSFAKGLSVRCNIPVVPINHIDGHVYSACIENNETEFPFIALVVSGGHTSLFYVESYQQYSVLGSTRDDACGEAFDKIAKMLGLPYPGGPEIDARSKHGNSRAIHFPRATIADSPYSFSFSGLKSSVRRYLQKSGFAGEDAAINDICASAQEAMVDVLVGKSVRAVKAYGTRQVHLSGGVAANSRLREQFYREAERHSFRCFFPSHVLSTDNAAMIGFLAEKKLTESNTTRYNDLRFPTRSTTLRAAYHQ